VPGNDEGDPVGGALVKGVPIEVLEGDGGGDFALGQNEPHLWEKLKLDIQTCRVEKARPFVCC
jgi:hypothetical protein